MYESSADSRDGATRRDDRGFTLIEILIAIVLVGILSAVAVVGISNLVSKGSKSSCGASKDSATAASAVYFASVTPNAYPTTFTLMISNGALSLPSGVSVNTSAVSPVGALPAGAPIGTQASSGTSWYLTMTGGGGATAPIFDCKP
jgi:prepilin-type N-terminal cleavage/methylation domain-containing protein